MTQSQIIKELNAMEAFAYATIEKAERLRFALDVSTSGALKKKQKGSGELSDEQVAKILGRRRKYYEKKAARLNTNG